MCYEKMRDIDDIKNEEGYLYWKKKYEFFRMHNNSTIEKSARLQSHILNQLARKLDFKMIMKRKERLDSRQRIERTLFSKWTVSLIIIGFARAICWASICWCSWPNWKPFWNRKKIGLNGWNCFFCPGKFRNQTIAHNHQLCEIRWKKHEYIISQFNMI